MGSPDWPGAVDGLPRTPIAHHARVWQCLVRARVLPAIIEWQPCRAVLYCTPRASRRFLRCLLARCRASAALAQRNEKSPPYSAPYAAAASSTLHPFPPISFRESSGGITLKQFSPNKSWVQPHTRVESVPRARTMCSIHLLASAQLKENVIVWIIVARRADRRRRNSFPNPYVPYLINWRSPLPSPSLPCPRSEKLGRAVQMPFRSVW